MIAGDIEYWKFPKELSSIEDAIISNQYIRENSFDYWYIKFYNTCCKDFIDPETEDNCITGKSYLSIHPQILSYSIIPRYRKYSDNVYFRIRIQKTTGTIPVAEFKIL